MHTLELKLDQQQPPVAISGDVSFTDSKGSKRTLPFFVSLKLADFVLPLRIKTRDFGEKWVALTQESKITVDSPIMSDLSELNKLLSERLHLHFVELIGLPFFFSFLFLVL